MSRTFAIAGRLAGGSLVLLVRAYRLSLSPLLGPACRFEPTCSAYAEQAIKRFGVIHGSALAVRRILRCHPFAAAGLDPVPASSAKTTRIKTT